MTLPLLPTTGVGSFPKPNNSKTAKGTLDETSKKATQDFIKKQEELGIDVLVDGEFYCADMATDYGRALGLPIANWTRSYGNRFWRKLIVDKNLADVEKKPIRLEQFLYAQKLTIKPVKGMLTGPTTLANWGFNNFYKTREDLVLAWADIIKHEAEQLEKNGAKYIQIDEPAVGERHWEKELFKEAMKRVTQNLKAYTITHICYGNFVAVYDTIKHTAINQVDIELANELDLGKNSNLLAMMKEDRLTKYKDVAIGVIDVRPGVDVETTHQVKKRIYTALDILAPTDALLKKIWIKPDCGFRTTKNQDVAYAKMATMMEAVRQVREELK